MTIRGQPWSSWISYRWFFTRQSYSMQQRHLESPWLSTRGRRQLCLVVCTSRPKCPCGHIFVSVWTSGCDRSAPSRDVDLTAHMTLAVHYPFSVSIGALEVGHAHFAPCFAMLEVLKCGEAVWDKQPLICPYEEKILSPMTLHSSS